MMPKKISVIGSRGIPGISGGVEKHCEELYTRLAKKGYDVTVYARKPYFLEEKRFKSFKKVNIVYLWTPRNKHLEAIIHSFTSLIRARINARTVHVHAIGPALIIPLAKCMGMRVVATHHGPDYKREKWGYASKKILCLGEKCMGLFADRIIVVSKTIRSMMKNKYPTAKITYIPNGVSFVQKQSEEKILQKYNLKKKKFFLTVGRFVPEKAFHELIDSYEMIKTDWKLVICGDADHETDYSKKLKLRASHIPGIVLTGYIGINELMELYRDSGLFILPSHYEGLPLALLEALGYGASVLASDIPPHKEVSLSLNRYFSTGDRADLSLKINTLMTKEFTIDEKKLIKKRLIEEFNWDRIAAETQKEYERLA